MANSDRDVYNRFLHSTRKVFPDINKQRIVLSLYKNSERRLSLCKTQSELCKTFQEERTFLYKLKIYTVYLFNLFRKYSFKLSGMQCNLNFDSFINRQDYISELIRLATSTTSRGDFSTIVSLFITRCSEKIYDARNELLVCPWLTFFGFAETSKLLGTEAVRILKAHEEFLIEEEDKQRKNQLQDPEYYALDAYNFLCEHPGFYEALV